MQTKACSKCGVEKTIEPANFGRQGKYFRPDCKPCQRAQQAEYRAKNRAALNEKAAEYREANRILLAEKARAHHWANREHTTRRMRADALVRLYGITEQQYDDMLAEQGGGCALCGRRYAKRNLSVDHDHATGKVRGLLCGACNTALGALGDNEEGLLRALAYLRH